MTQEELTQIVTRHDLREFESNVISQLKDMIRRTDPKIFYTPKEFSEIVAMSYSNVIKYCQAGRLKAIQPLDGGAWLIHRDEIDRLINEAKSNLICRG